MHEQSIFHHEIMINISENSEYSKQFELGLNKTQMEADSNSRKRKIFLSRGSLKRSARPPGIYNIFQCNDTHTQSDVSFDNLSAFHVVGDGDFRNKLLASHHNKSGTQDLSIMNASMPSSQPPLNEQSLRKSVFDATHLSIKDRNKLIQVSEVNFMGRCRKAKNSLQKYKSGWDHFQQTMKNKQGRKDKKQSGVRVVVQDNPEMDQLINQSGCEYWRKSLRNNDKKLLKYFEGVKYQKNDILRMLQTSQGQRKLKQSVPTLREHTPKQGFVLGATEYQDKRTRSMNTGLRKYNAEEVFRNTWKNKDLSRLFHQF